MAAGLSGSYVQSTAAVDLTALGADDYLFAKNTGVERKSGGGSILTAAALNGGSPSTNGAAQSVSFSATDSTPTGTFTSTDDIYYQSYNAASQYGVRFTAPAGTGERTIKLYLGYYLLSTVTGNLNIAASISGAGAPTPVTLSFAPVLNADQSIVATFTYTAGATGQTITIDYYPDTQSVDGHTRYLSYRAAWVSSEASGATVVNLTVANFSAVEQAPQNALLLKPSAAALALASLAITVENSAAFVISLTVAGLTFLVKAAQNKLTLNNTAASLTSLAQAIGNTSLFKTTSASMTFLGTALQLKMRLALGTASLFFMSPGVTLMTGLPEVVITKVRRRMTRFRKILKRREY